MPVLTLSPRALTQLHFAKTKPSSRMRDDNVAVVAVDKLETNAVGILMIKKKKNVAGTNGLLNRVRCIDTY